jgi:hypothetical protein
MQVRLEYRRDPGAFTSTGSIQQEGTQQEFVAVEFREMMQMLARVLEPGSDETEVILQRTDRPGLLPYKLDAALVQLLRTNPEAAIESMEFSSQSPSLTAQRAAEATEPPRPIPAGHDALADSFGDVVYFRVRGHELECPGCGFWGMYTSPGLLDSVDREGAVFRTVFVCPKKCKERFAVTCLRQWGYVRVDHLLEGTLPAFYFPRAWNEGRPWVSRGMLEQKYSAYKAEKENVVCSER